MKRSLLVRFTIICLLLTVHTGYSYHRIKSFVGETISHENAVGAPGLSSIAVSAGTLNPGFTTQNTNYSLTVSNATNTMSVTPTAVSSDSSIIVHGSYSWPVWSGSQTGPLELVVGTNTITIDVTTTDNVTTIYTITVTRECSPALAPVLSTTSDGTLCNGAASLNISVSNPSPQTDISINGSIGVAGIDQWQSFVPGIAGATTQLQIQLNGQHTGLFTLTIYSGVGVSGTVLHTQQFTLNQSNSWYGLNLPNLNLAVGSDYTFRLQGGLSLGGGYYYGSYYSNYYGSNTSYCIAFRTMVAPTLQGTPQWYHNGTLISGANAIGYEATQPGSYSSAMVTATCGTMMSNAITIISSPTWFQDLDNDGFGNAQVSMQACGQPAGYVSDSTDCLDTSSSVSPNATEVLANGIDDDCDGAVDEITYCSYSFSSMQTRINSVLIGSISNYSYNNNAYTDYTSMSTNVELGSVQEFQISSYSEQFSIAIFIDYNDNGTFTDANEMVADGSASGFAAYISGSFTIPANVTPGAHRMRIISDMNTVMNSCYSFYGEIQDYTIIIACPSTMFPDLDGDHYGQGQAVTAICPIPNNFSVNNLDCNDTNSAIHPGAAEISNNGIDDNCNNMTDENPVAALGAALSFDGTGDHCFMQSGSGMPAGNSSYTIEAKIFANSMGLQGIADWGNDGTVNAANGFRLTSNGIENYWWGNDLTVVTGDISNAWHHIAATFDNVSGVRSIYLDGVLIGSDTPTGHNAYVWSAWTIGLTYHYNNGFVSEFFNGKMDEVRLWNISRSQAQIQAAMDCEISAASSGLVAYYHFNQGAPSGGNSSVNTLIDATGNGHNGTLQSFALNGSVSNWVAPGGVASGIDCPPFIPAPQVSASLTETCGPQEISLNITSGTLAGAASWRWYANACGDTYIGTGASVNVTPTTTTSYYARSEDGTLIGQCASITVTVNQLQTYYLDSDNDGHYVGLPVEACAIPGAGYNTTASIIGDCDDSDPNAFTSAILYTDADGDGYSTNVSQTLCFGAGLPSGYVLSATLPDCDDTIAAIHPGQGELLYNGFDDNCSGSIDEGYQITTQIVAAQCGTTLSALSSNISAISMVQATGYRFEVTNLSNNSVQVIEKPLQFFSLTQLPAYDYATTYSIRVELKRNGVWLGYYGPACLVSSPAVLSPGGAAQIAPQQCGITLSSISTLISTTSLSGVTGYRFRITNLTDPTAPNQVQVLDRPLQWFSLTMLSTYNYGTTYLVEVALKTNGTYSGFGSPCQISSPTAPLLAACGGSVSAAGTLIYTTSLAKVTSYRFEVTNLANNQVVTIDRPLHWFSFNNIPGFSPATNYSVRVAVMTSGVYSLYGDACLIVSPGTARQEITNVKDIVTPFDITAYPNPFTGYFMVKASSACESDVAIKIYDMTGRLLESTQVAISDLESLQLGERYPSGVYNLVISQGEEVRSARLIKR